MSTHTDDESMGDVWRDVKEARAEKRASNREQSAQILRDAGVEFESKNLGAHLIVTAECGVFDFWPGTGLWQRRGDPKQSRGVHSLMRKINAAKVADPKDAEIARLSAALSEALAQLEDERARNALPAGVEVSAYAIATLGDQDGAIKIERVIGRAGARWAVRSLFGLAMSTTGEWDDEPCPSERTDEWLNAHRFTTAQEAITAARTFLAIIPGAKP